MKFSIERNALRDALSFAAAGSKKASIPILEHVMISTGDKSITIIGHDLASCAEATLPAEIETPGAACIPADRLTRLIGGIKDGAHITFAGDGLTLSLKSGRSSYKLATLPTKDFPNPLTTDGAFTVELTADDCRRLFADPASIIPANDPRTFLQGAYLTSDDGVLSSVAADGIRLVAMKSGAKSGSGHPVIVPKDALPEIMKVASEDGGEFSWSDRILTVRKHGWRYSTKLVEGIYPDYRRVIAPVCPTFITVDRAELVAAVTRLDVLADHRSALSLSWGDGPAELNLTLSGNGEGVEGVPCEAADMKAGKISVASGPFLGLLEAISGTKVQLHIRSYRESFRLVDPDCPDLIAVQAPCIVFEQAQNAA